MKKLSQKSLAVEPLKTFTCPICDRTLQTKSSLGKHKRLHTKKGIFNKSDLILSTFKPNQYQCEKCYVIIKKPKDFKKHFRTHFRLKTKKKSVQKPSTKLERIDDEYNNEINYPQVIIEEDVQVVDIKIEPIDLNESLIEHKEEINCIQVFPHKNSTTKNSKNDSVRKKNNQENENDGPIKKKSTKRIKRSKRIKSSGAYPCTIQCGKAMQTRSGFLRHMKKHKLKGEVPGKVIEQPKLVIFDGTELGEFQCEQCYAVLKNRKSLLRHLQIHLRQKHEMNVKAAALAEGETAFVSNNSNHKIVKEGKFEVCQFCDARVVSLAQHMQEHSKTNVQKVECDICQKTIKSKDYLRKHMKLHINALPYHCDQCPKKFNMKANLTQHLFSHTTLRQFQCDQCGMKLKSVNCLRVHLRTHQTLELSYKCELCPMAYNNKHSLKYHMRIHAGDRPYVCNFCGRGFFDSSTMYVHKRLHTGENPYICHICGKSTKQASNLKSHYRHFHKITDITGKTIRGNARIFAKYTAEELRQNDLIELLNREVAKEKEKEEEEAKIVQSPVLNSYQVNNVTTLGAAKSFHETVMPPSPFSERSNSSFGDSFDRIENNPSSLVATEIVTPKKIDEPVKISPIPATQIKIEQILIQTDILDNIETDIVKQEEDSDVKDDLTTYSCCPETSTEIKCSTDANVKPDLKEEGKDNDEDDFFGGLSNEKKEKHSDTEDERNADEDFFGPPLIKKKVVKKKDKKLNRNNKGAKFSRCNICHKRYINYEKHMRTHNKNNAQPSGKQSKLSTCKICNKRYSCYADHITKHDANICPYECTHCHKTFRNRKNLRNHLIVHSDEKQIICDICGTKFFFLYGLRRHITMHTDERPLKCNECGKMFKEKASLRIHKKTHSGLKPYKCNLCEKTYATLMGLKLHVRVHTGERPYQCNSCDSAFYDGSTYRQHMRTHTGSRPYKCDICGKGHTQAGNLKSHLRHAHKLIVKHVTMVKE